MRVRWSEKVSMNEDQQQQPSSSKRTKQLRARKKTGGHSPGRVLELCFFLFVFASIFKDGERGEERRAGARPRRTIDHRSRCSQTKLDDVKRTMVNGLYEHAKKNNTRPCHARIQFLADQKCIYYASAVMRPSYASSCIHSTCLQQKPLSKADGPNTDKFCHIIPPPP